MSDAADAIEALEKRLDANAEDWACRLILADAYAEAGNARMEYCQRWMVEYRRRPFRSERFSDYSWMHPKSTAEWYGSELFPDVWKAMGMRPIDSANYHTRREAESALADALQRLLSEAPTDARLHPVAGAS